MVKGLGINENTLQKDAVILLNDYLADFLTYDPAYQVTGSGNGSEYKALESKVAVCTVYAGLFQILCQKCGIECYVETITNPPHAYNYIVFPDETILYTDVCWNDGSDNPSRYHQYLLLDRQTFFKRHKFDIDAWSGEHYPSVALE